MKVTEDGKLEGELRWRKGAGEPLELNLAERAIVSFLEWGRMTGMVRLIWPDFDPPRRGPGRPPYPEYDWGAEQVRLGRHIEDVIDDILRMQSDIVKHPRKTIRQALKRRLKP